MILLLLVWNWRYTARQLRSREWIWVHISNAGPPERNILKRQTILQQPVWSLHWCHLSNGLACARWQHRGMILHSKEHSLSSHVLYVQELGLISLWRWRTLSLARRSLKNAPCSAPSYLFFPSILIASLCLPEFIFIDFSRTADCITVQKTHNHYVSLHNILDHSEYSKLMDIQLRALF